MALAELYSKLENLEGGKELVEGFKGEISRINEGAKADRLKFEKQITDLTSARDELKGKVEEYEAHKGDKSPEFIALEKQVKTLMEKNEQSEKARLEEIEKRTNSEISAQTIAALTKANAIDPQELAKLITPQIKVQEDGSYGWTKEDGSIGSIEECTSAYLEGKTWAVKSNQQAGSGASGGAMGGNSQLAEMFKLAGVEPPKS